MTFSKAGTLILDNVTVATSNIQTSNVIDLNASIDFGVGVSLKFHTSATVGAMLYLYADPTGGDASFTVGSYDVPIDSASILVSPNHTVNAFFPLVRSARYVRAVIANLDAGQTITLCSLWSIIQTP